MSESRDPLIPEDEDALTDPLIPQAPGGGDSDELIRWYTVSYRAIIVWICVLIAVGAVIVTVVHPLWWSELGALISRTLSRAQITAGTPASSVRQARFTNLEGTVRVRKGDQVQWTAADVSIGLEEGDAVQTLRDGIARIAFADGAIYVVKPDTLIVIQQEAAQSSQQTASVAVQVTSGVVDLSTSRTTPESRVLFQDAEARIHRETRAQVTNDPETNTHRITVSAGGATVERGSEKVELAQFEEASFAGPNTSLVKGKVVSPPVLLTPANMAPVVMTSPKEAQVEFTWSAVAGVDTYRLRVSSSPIFADAVYDRRLQSTSVRVPSFKEGTYYWEVTSIGTAQKLSQESEMNQFSVIPQGSGGGLLLVVSKYVQHGKVIEIVGKAEPGATLLINNEPVFNVAPDGSFTHFTAPLPDVGANLITITAQNSKGKIATLQKTITIE